jgi:thiol-disulfide isomerase/thioredoxin/outer membrane lipoprotein-sorting protein
MRRLTPAWITLLALLALASPAFAQLQQAERNVLERTAGLYRTMGGFLFAGTIEISQVSSHGPQSQKAQFLVATPGHGMLHDEVTGGGATGKFVSNGRETWIYNGTSNQYMRRPGGADSVLKLFPNKGVGGMLVSRYGLIAQGANDARFLTDTVLTVDGVKRRCDVLEVTYEPQMNTPVKEDPRRFWIDKETYLVLRQRTAMHVDSPQYGKIDQVEVITFQRAAVDPQLPDSLWTFRPPEGALQVDDFQSSASDPGLAFRGKPAIDFTLKDLKGRPRTLKSLRGKTVLLDFWATWCGPCRLTMPQVAKVHAQYKNKGVEVMSINVGENAQKAGDYIAKNGYSFTTLLDEDRTVSTQYKVNGIPTLVVIDAKGNISDYLVGARDEAALKAALTKAGVK